MKKWLAALLCLCLVLPCVLPAQAQSGQDEAPTGIELPFQITQEETVIETERYRMTLESGIYVPLSIEDDVNLLLDTAEEITGLSYTPEVPVNAHLGKVQITVLNPDLHDGQVSAFAMLGGVTVSAPDILLWSGNGWSLMHELVHCLQFRNGSVLSPTLAEGFATATVYAATGKAAFPISLDSYFNYALGENPITAKDAQAQFLALDQTEDSWNNYLYGFPMLLYMNEVYGRDAFLKLITLIKDEYSVSGDTVYAANHTNKEILPAILSATSEDFFAGFGAWYEENGERLNPAQSAMPANDYARFDRIHVFPMCFYTNFYDTINTSYTDSLIVDFTTGNRYLSEYKHIASTDFSGVISAKGQSTFTFYTAKGEELEAFTIHGDLQVVTVDNASVIRITGDGQPITVEANFDAMTASK